MSISTAANKVLETEDMGILTWEMIARAALNFMSDDDIAQMADAEEFYAFEEMAKADEVYFDVSIIREGGGHSFLERFEDEDYEEAGDAEIEADTFAEEYSNDNGVTIIVERVTDNGGDRRQSNIFEIESEVA